MSFLHHASLSVLHSTTQQRLYTATELEALCVTFLYEWETYATSMSGLHGL